jgi:hypothetical protein
MLGWRSNVAMIADTRAANYSFNITVFSRDQTPRAEDMLQPVGLQFLSSANKHRESKTVASGYLGSASRVSPEHVLLPTPVPLLRPVDSLRILWVSATVDRPDETCFLCCSGLILR